MNKIIEQIRDKVKEGNHNETVALVNKALKDGVKPKSILQEGLIEGMMLIGDLFQKNQAFIPDMLQSSRAMSRAMEILEKKLKGEEVKSLGKIIIGTVKGDLHDIGKNLVGIMYKSIGFDIVDLGIDVPTERFVGAVRESGAKVVSLSALITTTMTNQEATLRTLKKEFSDKVKVLVGGAPVTQEWADSIGADGYSPDAFGAAILAKRVAGS